MINKKITIASLLALGAIGLSAQTKASTILPPNAPFQKEFGTSIAMAGNSNMVIGSEFEKENGAVYHYQGTTFKTKINGKDIDPTSSYFGLGTALNQTWLVVGAPSSGFVEKGKLFLFRDNSSNYNFATTPVQTIVSPSAGSRFGFSVAIDGDWISVGARESGTVYIYKRTGTGATSWVLRDSLKQAGNFGNAVAMNGNRLVVGAENYNGTGNVYVYERNASEKYVLTYDRSLNGRPTWASSAYGVDVDITSNAIIVGDRIALKAEVLTSNGSSWTQNSVLSSSVTHGNFGQAVAIQYNRAIVGAPFEFGVGKVYLYTQLNNVYTYQNELVVDATNLTISKLGGAVDISENDFIGATASNSGIAGYSGNDKGVAFYNNFSSAIQSCGSTYESNNSTASATTLAVNSSIQSCINSSTDVDFYKFVLSSADNLTITLENLAVNYDLQVLNSGGSVIYSSTASGTTSETILASLSAAGTYYIKVFGVSGANSSTRYKLTVKTNLCNESLYEPNNTMATAKIYQNMSQNNARDLYAGIMNSTDVDWYGFDTYNYSSGYVYNNIKITLTNLAADFDMRLYDSAGDEIGFSGFGGTRDEQIIINGSYIGRHYIKIFGYLGANSTQCYDLKVDISSTPQARTEAAEAVEKTTGLALFPNPALAGETISLNLNQNVEDAVHVRVLNINGLVVSEQNLKVSNHTATLDLSNIKAGIYLIDAGDAGKTKLVVE